MTGTNSLCDMAVSGEDYTDGPAHDRNQLPMRHGSQRRGQHYLFKLSPKGRQTTAGEPVLAPPLRNLTIGEKHFARPTVASSSATTATMVQEPPPPLDGSDDHGSSDGEGPMSIRYTHG
jgi:hypothetical protein